jgi:predicted hotdog family 3-hydroxylacyl-ACP dehydratase
MTTSLDIQVDEKWCEGHFPGRPILPGVSQLALVLDALAHHRGQPLVLSAIGFARLRQPVVPGDRLRLTADERPDGALRITLARQGTMVSNAELRLGPHRTGAAPAALVTTGSAIIDAPPVETLLPHQPPMRFVTCSNAESADGLTCSARIPARCALVAHGSAPAVAAIEAAAQTAALWEATRRRREGAAAPRLGYLVGLRDVTFFAQRIPAETSFFANVRLEAATLPLTHYAMQIDLGSTPVLHGTLATFLTDEAMPG